MTRLRLALFDMDGTLVDSQGHITQSMARAFEHEGLVPPDNAAVRAIIGLSLPMAVARLAPGLEPAALERVVAVYKDTYVGLRSADGAASSPLFPGALDCLERLGGDPAVMLGVATGKSRRGLSHVLEMHGLNGRFDTLQVADDHPSKPHPAMVLQALAETGVASRDVVMIGDTTYDMEMGRAAGVRCLGVAWGYHAPSALRSAGAEVMAQGFDDVPGLLDTLWETTNE